MRVTLLSLLLTGCLDVVQHGTPVELALNMLDCDRTTVVNGATELRYTATTSEGVVFSKAVPLGEPLHTISIEPNADVVMQVEAVDAEGRLIAKGSSIHFASPSETPVAIQLYRAGQFTRSCNSLVTARAFHSATVLRDGRVLVVGGTDSTGTALSAMEIVTSSEVRDVGPLAITSQMRTFRLPRAHHAAVVLENGYVLISGGENGPGILSSGLVVDPTVDFATGAISPASQPVPRSRHIAVKAGGRVLFVGGVTRSSTETVANEVVERLDLETFRIDSVSSIPGARLEAALGSAGPVALMAGGLEGTSVSKTIDLVSIDPRGLTRQLMLSTPRRGGQLVTHGNRALLVGGFDGNGAALATTEWIDADPPGTSGIPGPTVTARGETCAVALSGGRTLLLGNSRTPELLNANDTVEQIPFPGAAATGQTCLLEEDGSVLVIGGLDATGRPLDEIWRYVPPQ